MSETPRTLPELIEALSAIEHERWTEWQRWVHGLHVGETDTSGNPVDELRIPFEHVMRWQRQIETPYANLSEREQRSDREQVMRYWPMLAKFVEEWLLHDGYAPAGTIQKWREEMSEDNAENWVVEASMTQADWAQAATYD